MPTWSSFLIGVIFVLTWVNLNSITAIRTYDEARLSQLRDEVKSMFYHAYDSYIRHAYPLDELRPLSCDGVDTWGSYSLTLIDTLDTLAVIGNYSEFRRVAQLIIDNAHFDLNINVSVFETNIRIIGGLLSAHLLSHKAGMNVEKGWPCNGPLLRLAEKVARKLLPAFDTPTGMPFGTVNLRFGVPPKETPITCTAGVGTFIVEFGVISRLTGDPLYEKVALRALHSLYSKRSKLDLVGNHIDTATGRWTALDSGIGAGVDSYFEYLVKGAILFQKPELMHMFRVSFDAIEKHLGKSGWYIWATMGHGHVSTATFQSLEAYWPGLLSLVGEFRAGLKAITNYHRIWKQYGGLPELYNILQGKAAHQREGYPLRPELVESAMYLYRATGNPFMLEIGEDILHSIAHNTRTECGYATVRDVSSLTLEDRMESFFLAETLKYLYLLFDPNNFLHSEGEDYVVIDNPLGKCTVYAGGYIFNTEAHPIDPSALQCCTGVTERELHDEVATIDEFRTSSIFKGRKRKKPKRGKGTVEPEPTSTTTAQTQSGVPVPPQVLQTETKVKSPPTTTSSPGFVEKVTNPEAPTLITLDLHRLQELRLALDKMESPSRSEDCTNPLLSLYDDEKSQICKPNEKPKTLGMDSTTALKTILEDKQSLLENLLKKLVEEQQGQGSQVSELLAKAKFIGSGDIENEPIPIKTQGPSTDNFLEVKYVKQLVQNIEKTMKATTTTVSKPGAVEQPVLGAKHKNNNRILKKRAEQKDPDLDLIFGTSTTGRSLSFYFSLKWMNKFPDLITQLIPSERFDIQNFYSRINRQFSNEGFVKDFNMSLAWTRDYDVLKCKNLDFTDRFMFLRSSTDD